MSNTAFLHRARDGTLNAAKMAGSLTEKQRECLAYWPNGYFTEGTRKALRDRGLVKGNARTEDGERVLRA